MGLTSGFFIGLVIAAALASVAVTVWLWPRLASQRIAVIAGRLGLIAASQVLVISAILFMLNGYLGFFASWSDLFGGGSAAPAAATGIVASSRPIVVTGTDLGPVPGGSALPETADGRLAAKPPHVYAQHPALTGRPAAPGL